MSSRTDARDWWIPAGLALLALVIRIPGLNGGLWADEIYSTMYAFRTSFPASLAEFHGDNKHPFYSLLAHASLSVFGEAPWSLRLPSLLFGAATVPMLYLLGRRIADRREAVAAALLLAVSYHHVWFSQNARGYSILAFCAVTSTWLLLRVLRDDDARAALAFAVVIAIGVYTHLTFVFAVLAQGIVALLAVLGWPRASRRPGWLLGIGPFVAGGVITLLLYAPMLSKVVHFFVNKESNLKGISSPSWALAEAFRVLSVGLGGGVMVGVGMVVLTIAGIVGLSGLVSYLRSDRQVALLLVLPAFTLLAGAFASRGTMYPRFFFLLVGYALLIGMRGAYATAGWVAERIGRPAVGRMVAAAAIGVLVIASLASLPREWRLPKQDYEGAMRFVEGQGSSDAVAMADMTTEIYGKFFGRRWHDVRDVGTLEALRKEGKVWFVYTFPRYLARYDATLADFIERECRPERVFPGSVGGGDVIVCSLSPTGTS